MTQTKRKRGRPSKKGSKTDILNNLDDNLKKINEISKSSQSNIKILAVASSKSKKNEEPNVSKKTEIIETLDKETQKTIGSQISKVTQKSYVSLTEASANIEATSSENESDDDDDADYLPTTSRKSGKKDTKRRSKFKKPIYSFY